MANVNVTIIGLNRMGASFGLALKRVMQDANVKHSFVIVGSDQDHAAMQTARKMGAIDQETRDLEDSVAKADLVILAAPYGMTGDIYSVIGPALRPGAVVMDTSPLKLSSIAWGKEHLRRDKDKQPEAYMVGVTPIVNPAYLEDYRTEAEAASADYFDKGVMIVSPAPDCPQEAVQLVAELSDLMGLKVHFTDPAEHDGLVALVEGLPLLMHLGLFRNLSTSQAWGDIQRLTNPSFSQATRRLTEGNAQDLTKALTRNRANTLHALESLIGTLDELRDLLASGDDMEVEQAFADALDRYERWQSARRTNKWDSRMDMPPIPSGGILGNMLGPLGRRRSKDDGDKK